jgi:hypothetical protein
MAALYRKSRKVIPIVLAEHAERPQSQIRGREKQTAMPQKESKF